jgi:hypothetical protein
VIYSSAANVYIKNSLFERNNAGTAGSALYLSCSNTDLCFFDVRHNNFSNNIAGIKGGAIFYDF